jgi:(E)-4-hydroxy-3-methylbut-2-enyl-diphosphate synthase
MVIMDNSLDILRRFPPRESRRVMVGGVPGGGGAPISIQSMTNTVTADHGATLGQIRRLASGGCQIIRVAVADGADVGALPTVAAQSPLPVIADIHFDYRLAIGALEAGVAGLRINPGNIGEAWKVREVVAAAKDRGVPIRVGVNGGSLEAGLLEKYGGPTASALVESALAHVGMLESLSFYDIKISLKSSRVPVMLAAYREIAHKVDYPLHVGVTETGLPAHGLVKSAVGIGALLAEGIGDTIRVSLTGDPAEEVAAARQILASLELAPGGLQIVACPTCGRTQVDLPAMVLAAEERLKALHLPDDRNITVAIMGCPVNGPGEAREADYGIACGKGSGVLFAGGKQLSRHPESELIDALCDLIARGGHD